MESVSAAIVAALGQSVKTAVPGLEPDGPSVSEPELLIEYSPGEKPWDVHRAQADAVQEIYAGEEFARFAERISQCSQVLDYAWIEDSRTRETGELRFKLKRTRFCRVRTCPICQWRRSLMWFARFRKAVEKIQKEQENPSSYSFIFLTLTVKNCPISDLRSTLIMMRDGWHRFIKRKAFADIKGWVRTTEITYGAEGTAHPHYHVLLMVRNSWYKKSYVSQASWQEAWMHSARLDYLPQVDVRKVRPQGPVSNSQEGVESPMDGLWAAAAETLKYAVKPGDAISHPDWFRELTRQIVKLRFLAAGGLLKDALREEDESEQGMLLMEETKEQETEHGRVSFNWQKPIQHYRRQANQESGWDASYMQSGRGALFRCASEAAAEWKKPH